MPRQARDKRNGNSKANWGVFRRYLKVKRDECAEFPDEAVPEGDEKAAAERKEAVDALCKKLYQPLI